MHLFPVFLTGCWFEDSCCRFILPGFQSV
jgi:hypothetical protein